VFAFGQKLSALALHFGASVEESHGTAGEKTTDSYSQTFPFRTETSTPLNPPGWVVFHPYAVDLSDMFLRLTFRKKQKSITPQKTTHINRRGCRDEF